MALGGMLTVSMTLPIISLIAFTLDKFKPLGEDNGVSRLDRPTVSDLEAQQACCGIGKGRWITPRVAVTYLACSMTFVCFCVFYGSRRLLALSNSSDKRDRTRDHVVAWQVAWEQSKEGANVQRDASLARFRPDASHQMPESNMV
jgi:hypothetical protein